MKKSILNVGIALAKAEQKKISGGFPGDPGEEGCIESLNTCSLGSSNDCPPGEICSTLVYTNEYKFSGSIITWDTYENRCICPPI